MATEDEPAWKSRSLEHRVVFFVLLLIYYSSFFIRHNHSPFDKVTASNNCSGNVAHEPFFCIATTNVPLIIATQPDLCVHIIDTLIDMSVLMCLEN